MLAEVEKDLGCGKGNGETERRGGGGGAGAHLELVLWNHVVVSQSVQQRKRVVYRHRDLGAVQSQQAAQCPIPARHRFEADCVSAPPSGMCALAYLGCPGTYSPAGERRRLACFTALLYFQPEKSRGCYSPLEPIRARFLQAGDRDCPTAGFRSPYRTGIHFPWNPG